MTDQEFDDLADRLTDAEYELPRDGFVARGAEAAAHGHQLMAREFVGEAGLALALRAGRPRTGELPRGESPTVRGRISEADFEAFKRLEVQSGKKQSELVREAVHLLLVQNRLAS